MPQTQCVLVPDISFLVKNQTMSSFGLRLDAVRLCTMVKATAHFQRTHTDFYLAHSAGLRVCV